MKLWLSLAIKPLKQWKQSFFRLFLPQKIWRFGLVGGDPFLITNISRLRSKKFYVQNENKANSAQLELKLWLSLALKPIKQWKQSFLRIFWPQKIWRFGLVGGGPFLITNISRLRSKKFYVQNENMANSAQLELKLWQLYGKTVKVLLIWKCPSMNIWH